MSMQTLELNNVGPVAHISIPVPENGGIVVLKGRNGRGKTKTLEAVESAISGRGKLEVRDGQLNGEFKGFGVTLKVSSRTTRRGELTVDSLDGRLSVAELVDPGIDKPEAADAKRIRALVQLANVLPSAELFYPLLGSREALEAVVGTNALGSEDLVTMADRMKRDLHQAALHAEGRTEQAEGRARGAREAAAGIDVEIETDAAKLQTELEDAVRRESQLKSQAQSAARAHQQYEQAKASLAAAEANYSGPSIDDAKLAESQRQADVNAAESDVRELESRLQDARQQAELARQAYSSAISTRKTAEQHQSLIDKYRQELAAALPVAPAEDLIVEAAAKVTAARTAIEKAALARQAKQRLAEADQHAAEAKEHRDRAVQLRDAAKATDDVLSGVVAKSSKLLRVEVGRLVLDTDRGVTYFGDLSHGERWKLALDVAIDAVGDRGVLMIPQEAYESLDPQNRLMIRDHVVGRGVTILTAEASDDEEIRAEVLN